MILKLFDRYKYHIWTVSFVLFLFAPTVLYPVLRYRLDTTDYEKRAKAPRPSVSVTELSVFPEAFNSYYSDHLPFRNELIGINSRIDYYIFKDSPNDRVVFGDDGWLFYTGEAINTSTGKTMLSEEELKEIGSNLQNASDYFRKLGIEFLVFIAPNKETVYRDKLPAYYTVYSDITVGKQLADYLKANTDINVVWPYDEIMKARDEYYTYCHLDTHWNNVGSYIGACEAAGVLGTPMQPLNKLTVTPVTYSRGDLSDMMHLILKNSDTDYAISGYEDEGYPVEQFYGEFIEFHNESGDDRTVVMRRDSYGIRLSRFLSGQFKDMYVMTSDSPMDTINMFGADVFIYEIVERNAKDIRINLPDR